jgi:transcriptional regulator with XRE-family HTH domain
MPTSEQLHAARALLGLTMTELAELAGVSNATIARAERGIGLSMRTYGAIVAALEVGGIEFLRANTTGGIGVRLRRRP